MGGFVSASGDVAETYVVEAGGLGDGPHAPPVIGEMLDNLLGFFYRVLGVQFAFLVGVFGA